MSKISALLDVPFEKPFGVTYQNGKIETSKYIIKETGLFTETGRPTPYVLINILTGKAGIIKE